MNLDEFISTSLVSISSGIKNANIKINQSDPTFRILKGYDNDKKNQGFIDFDIAVTASSKNEKNGKAGIFIKVVEFGGTSTNTKETANISRIQFSVSVNREIT